MLNSRDIQGHFVTSFCDKHEMPGTYKDILMPTLVIESKDMAIVKEIFIPIFLMRIRGPGQIKTT